MFSGCDAKVEIPMKWSPLRVLPGDDAYKSTLAHTPQVPLPRSWHPARDWVSAHRQRPAQPPRNDSFSVTCRLAPLGPGDALHLPVQGREPMLVRPAGKMEALYTK